MAVSVLAGNFALDLFHQIPHRFQFGQVFLVEFNREAFLEFINDLEHGQGIEFQFLDQAVEIDRPPVRHIGAAGQ